MFFWVFLPPLIVASAKPNFFSSLHNLVFPFGFKFCSNFPLKNSSWVGELIILHLNKGTPPLLWSFRVFVYCCFEITCKFQAWRQRFRGKENKNGLLAYTIVFEHASLFLSRVTLWRAWHISRHFCPKTAQFHIWGSLWLFPVWFLLLLLIHCQLRFSNCSSTQNEFGTIPSLQWSDIQFLLSVGGFIWWSAERWWVSVVEKGGSRHVQKQKISAVIGLTQFFRYPINCLSLKHQNCALYHVCNRNGIRYPAKSKPMLCCCVCSYQTAMVFYDHIQYFLLITISLEDNFSSVTCTSAIFWL